MKFRCIRLDVRLDLSKWQKLGLNATYFSFVHKTYHYLDILVTPQATIYLNLKIFTKLCALILDLPVEMYQNFG